MSHPKDYVLYYEGLGIECPYADVIVDGHLMDSQYEAVSYLQGDCGFTEKEAWDFVKSLPAVPSDY